MRLRCSKAFRKLVPCPIGSQYNSSRMIRSTWRVPFRGGTNFSISSVNSVRPTLSFPLIAENAKRRAQLGHKFALRLPVGAQGFANALRSTSSMTAISRSSRNSFTNGRPVSSRHVPVDRPHVVAKLIRPNFFELDAAAFERGVPLPRQQLIDDVRRMNLDAANLFDDFAGSMMD